MKLIDKSGCLGWEEQGPVGIIRLEGRMANTIPSPDFADPEIVRQWVNRNEVKGVIVTGKGKHFSAGADMEQFKEFDYSSKAFIDSFQVGREVLSIIENLEKPVIAAIDGVCLGGGLEIALACHMRYCNARSIFGFTELNHGIIPALGGIDRLAYIVGRSKTLELLLTGDTFDAQYALDIGVVNKIVNEKSCFDYTMEAVKGIISKGEKPVAYAIKAVNNSCNMNIDQAMAEESRMFTELVINQFGNGEKKDEQ